MWGALFLDALREIRFWAPPSSSCPWGLLILAIWIACLCGCCLGLCLGALAASRACRQLVLQVFTLILHSLAPAPVVARGSEAIQRRLGEYRA
eukprot:s2015_g18.t1